MKEEFPSPRSAIENRFEYRECDLEMLELLTDMADELILSHEQASGKHRDTSSFDAHNSSMIKSFAYIESNETPDSTLPITETEAAILYTKRTPGATTEAYQIGVTRTVHHEDISPASILTVYNIEFFGKNRENHQATVESTNILDGSAQGIDSWGMTDYDSMQLFVELDRIKNLQRIQANEQQLLDDLS